jgi:hypothetical protein
MTVHSAARAGSPPFSGLAPDQDLGELRLTISAGANERYWRATGADHPLLRAGTLYPPIATNLTVLLFGQVCPKPVIQTRQRLRCHRTAAAGTELVTRGRVTACYEKRGRAYVDVEAVVATADAPDDPLWTSAVSFTPAATFGAAR